MGWVVPDLRFQFWDDGKLNQRKLGPEVIPTVQIERAPVIRNAPQVVGESLRADGFTDIR